MSEQDGIPGLQEQVTPEPIHLLMILDVSPSMHYRWGQTLSGLNEYFDGLRADQKANDQPYVVTLTTFSADINTPFEAVDLDVIPKFTEKNLSPHGYGTALYDACGPAIEKLTYQGPNLVVIVTDGEENSSRKWDESRLAKLIDERSKLGNYTFAYLGVAKEAWGNAAKMGTAVSRSSLNMQAADYGAATYKNLADLTATYSSNMRGATMMRRAGNSNVSMSVNSLFDQSDAPAAQTAVDAVNGSTASGENK